MPLCLWYAPDALVRRGQRVISRFCLLNPSDCCISLRSGSLSQYRNWENRGLKGGLHRWPVVETHRVSAPSPLL